MGALALGGKGLPAFKYLPPAHPFWGFGFPRYSPEQEPFLENTLDPPPPPRPWPVTTWDWRPQGPNKQGSRDSVTSSSQQGTRDSNRETMGSQSDWEAQGREHMAQDPEELTNSPEMARKAENSGALWVASLCFPLSLKPSEVSFGSHHCHQICEKKNQFIEKKF